MPEDLMRYDLLAQDALRGVVREALRRVIRSGLPGEHHFYIAFDTRHPAVRISERLAKRYPREMTVVIQHQYSNLMVNDEEFEVELWFDKIPEKLGVPFAAVKGFLDPYVQFGLQFETASAPAKPQSKAKSKPAAEVAQAGEDAKPVVEPVTESIEKAEEAPTKAPKVVSLDAFRKKT
jgi:uncharacterized protein